MLDLPNWLLIIPVLAFLIFIHELGHFATAKWFGIKVTEFGFGFPPRAFGVRYRGTVYSVNWIPIGGFVRIVGEEDPTDPDSFARQSVLKRSVVLLAGSFMNLVLPVVIFTVLFMLPHETLLGGDVIIAGVAPASPAKVAGLRRGDAIRSVDGHPVTDPGELIDLVRGRAGQPIALSIRRAPAVTGFRTSPEFMDIALVTVVPRRDPPKLRVVEVVTDRASEVSLAEARRYDNSLAVGDTMTQGAIGVRIGLANAKFGRTTDPIWRAVPRSFETIWNILVFTWNGIVEGVATRSNPGIAGPIGIAHATDEVVSQLGFSWIFQLTALLSISLGVLNILPIPALDGGRLAFVILEWARRGKRISPRREGLVHLVGFVIVIGLILVLSYYDIVRILGGESLIR